NPLERTEWNVRDSDVALIITDGAGMAASIGTKRGQQWAHQPGKPLLIVDASEPDAPTRVGVGGKAQQQRFGADMQLASGDPRETEAQRTDARAGLLIAARLDHCLEPHRQAADRTP